MCANCVCEMHGSGHFLPCLLHQQAFSVFKGPLLLILAASVVHCLQATGLLYGRCTQCKDGGDRQDISGARTVYTGTRSTLGGASCEKWVNVERRIGREQAPALPCARRLLVVRLRGGLGSVGAGDSPDLSEETLVELEEDDVEEEEAAVEAELYNEDGSEEAEAEEAGRTAFVGMEEEEEEEEEEESDEDLEAEREAEKQVRRLVRDGRARYDEARKLLHEEDGEERARIAHANAVAMLEEVHVVLWVGLWA